MREAAGAGRYALGKNALWSQMGIAISNIRLGAEDAVQKAVDRLRTDLGQDKRMVIAACMVADLRFNFRYSIMGCLCISPSNQEGTPWPSLQAHGR